MSDIYYLPLTSSEETGKTRTRPVRACARIAIVVQQNDERTCLFVRHPTKGLELPGGAIEAGEKPLQAGLRELSEEAGIQLPVNHPFTLMDMVPIIDHRGGCWLDIIYGAVATPLQLITQEEAELPVCWLNAKEIEDQVDQYFSSYNVALRALKALNIDPSRET